MRAINRTTRFKRDYKRERKSDAELDAKLFPVLSALTRDETLEERFKDHGLTGNWKGFRDCHIRPDLVLIYELVDEDTLSLVRLGSHSELFG